MSSSKPLIVCPLDHERRELARASWRDRCELHVSGPGAAAMVNWCTSIEVGNRPVILAGLAGGLQSHVAAGDARAIASVIRQGAPAMVPPLSDSPAWTVASSLATLCTPRAKREFGSATAADVVDMESQSFAEHAEARGWRWGIVRGVSDSLNMTLPADIDSWIDDRGRNRWMRIAASLAMHSSNISAVIRLARHSAAAMQSVQNCVGRLLVKSQATP